MFELESESEDWSNLGIAEGLDLEEEIEELEEESISA